MKKPMKRPISRRNIVLFMVLLGVTLAWAGSMAFARPASQVSAQGNVTMIDPFSMTVITVPYNPMSPGAVREAVLITPRARVRVPGRLPLRSAFHPNGSYL